MASHLLRKFICQLFIFSTALTASLYSQSVDTPSSKLLKLNSNNDHGIWLEQLQRADINKDWFAMLHTEQRWGSDYRLSWYQEYELVLQYDLLKLMKSYFCIPEDSVVKTFSIGPGFNQYTNIQRNTLGNFKWVWISRPIIELNMNILWNGWLLTQRIRGEYQSYNSSHYKDYGNARYRIVLAAPWKFTCYNITPYISNEFFFRNNTYHTTSPNGLVGGLYEDRFRLGLAADFIKDRFLGALYWQWRPLKQKPGVHPGYFNTYHIGLFVNIIY